MSDNKNTREHVNKASGNAEWPMGKITNALALEPTVAIAYVRFAIYYQSKGMREETEAALDKGLAVLPDDEILLMMRRDIGKSEDPLQLAHP